jgi:hypothetical protein
MPSHLTSERRTAVLFVVRRLTYGKQRTARPSGRIRLQASRYGSDALTEPYVPNCQLGLLASSA